MNATEQIYKLQESYVEMMGTINFKQTSLKMALFFVAFNPFFWNIVSRIEYYTHFITKFVKSPTKACYIFAATIFSLGIIRNYFFNKALDDQMTSLMLQNEFTKTMGVVLIVVGQILVLTSMYKLGIVGTYCGDYFGILMTDRVTDFPFNVVNNPMYRGSTLTFLGYSLLYEKAAGLLITLFVHIIYEIAIKFEEPFTTKIYATKNGKSA